MLKREHFKSTYKPTEVLKNIKKPINVILILVVLNQRHNKTLGGIDLLTYTESRSKQRNQSPSHRRNRWYSGERGFNHRRNRI